MNRSLDTLGIIAGSGSLPMLLARQARALGVQGLVAVAFENETDPELAGLVDKIVWIKVGQLSRMIAAFTDNAVAQCVMAGQIAPRNLFQVRPDLRAMSLLFKLKEKNAHTLFGAIADEFVAFGYRIAKEVSRLEIGQTVVVKNGTVLAVEGFEGTDQCLARGGELAGPSGAAVAVKVAKEKHDLRFDIPCIGLKTLETAAVAGIAVLALEPGKTLILEQDAVTLLVEKQRITLTTTALEAAP